MTNYNSLNVGFDIQEKFHGLQQKSYGHHNIILRYGRLKVIYLYENHFRA
jgi:hypothetical protein